MSLYDSYVVLSRPKSNLQYCEWSQQNTSNNLHQEQHHFQEVKQKTRLPFIELRFKDVKFTRKWETETANERKEKKKRMKNIFYRRNKEKKYCGISSKEKHVTKLSNRMNATTDTNRKKNTATDKQPELNRKSMREGCTGIETKKERTNTERFNVYKF